MFKNVIAGQALATPQKYAGAYIEARGEQTFVLERKFRCRKARLSASVMPTNAREGDVAIPLTRVPLAIRQAARAHLFGVEP